MMQERAPEREQSLTNEPRTTSWEFARGRLTSPEPERMNWLATVRPDGRPHLMPVITGWIEGSFYFIAGESTRKARNLAANARCVIGTASRTLPSLDIIAEGRAKPLSDEDAVRRIAEAFGGFGWPLEARGVEVFGPNAPTAGAPPYRIYRMVPDRVFGLPGTYGMDQFEPADLPKPTRWEFGAD